MHIHICTYNQKTHMHKIKISTFFVLFCFKDYGWRQIMISVEFVVVISNIKQDVLGELLIEV